MECIGIFALSFVGDGAIIQTPQYRPPDQVLTATSANTKSKRRVRKFSRADLLRGAMTTIGQRAAYQPAIDSPSTKVLHIQDHSPIERTAQKRLDGRSEKEANCRRQSDEERRARSRLAAHVHENINLVA